MSSASIQHCCPSDTALDLDLGMEMALSLLLDSICKKYNGCHCPRQEHPPLGPVSLAWVTRRRLGRLGKLRSDMAKGSCTSTRCWSRPQCSSESHSTSRDTIDLRIPRCQVPRRIPNSRDLPTIFPFSCDTGTNTSEMRLVRVRLLESAERGGF